MSRPSVADPRTLEERVLILAPSHRDGPTVAEILDEAGLVGEICTDLTALCHAVEHGGGAGAALIAEEALGREQHVLRDCLERQPPWSDLPIVLVAAATAGQRGPTRRDWTVGRFAELGNATLLERPLRSATLVSALRSALRARRRQYQVREHLRERVRTEERLRAQETELRRLNEDLEQRIAAAIADRSRIEAAFRQAQKMEAIGQLTGGVAHDFNNLLSAVLGNLELLDMRVADNEAARRLVRNAVRAAERGAKLTQQLLAFARKQHLRPEPVDVNETVAGMEDLLTRTIGPTIRLRTALEPALWPAFADPSQIELVILNLAINARDAMPLGGSLVIETANLPASAPGRPADAVPGDLVRIAVTDTGTGMSEEILAKIFEPFFSTKEVGKGTGLGLAQVYGVAKQLGGDVRVRSRLGEGTRVEIYLRRTEGVPDRAADGAAAAPAEAAVRPVRARILLVDDDPDVREVVADGLESLGYEVRAASGARAGLDLLDRVDGDGRTDLLVADFAMPEMNGTELVRAARARRPDLPVVLITGYAEQALGSEFDGLVKKPFKLAELARAVEKALRREPPARTASNVVPLNPTQRA